MSTENQKRVITFVQLTDEITIKLSTKPSDIRKAAKRVLGMIAYRRDRIAAKEGTPLDRMGLEAWALIIIMHAAFPDPNEKSQPAVEPVGTSSDESVTSS